MINENFVFNLFIIKKVLTKSLKSSSKLFNFDENTEIILLSMIQIIRKLKINNYVERFIFKFSKFVEKLFSDNKLLIMIKFFII